MTEDQTKPVTDRSDSTPEKTRVPVQPPTAPSPVAQVKSASNGMKYGYYWGTGRRKTSVARVRIRPGKGEFVVNKRPVNEYFSFERDRNDAAAPLKATNTGGSVDVFVNVRGGGTTGQAGAILLGLSRALCVMDQTHLDKLRDGNYLTRDSRKVERKKYGRSGARKRFQFSKR